MSAQGANEEKTQPLHDEALRRQGKASRSSGEHFTCSTEAQFMIHAQSEAALSGGHSRRERIALGVFFCLLLLGAIALISYISAGHSLNVAATSIDDITGDMSGYGVILFEGTVVADASADEDDYDGGIISEVLDAVGLGDEDDSGEEAVSNESDGASSSGSSQSETTETQDSTDAESDSSESSDSSSAAIYSSSRLDVSSSDITIEEVQQEYLDKGASVISLNSANLQVYSAGCIITKGERTYGIFSLTEDDLSSTSSYNLIAARAASVLAESTSGDSDSATTRTREPFTSVSGLFAFIEEDDIGSDVIEKIESILEYFEGEGVDTVIALTPSTIPFYAVEGVDVVVTFKESNRFSMSATIDGTLYVDAPEVGQVGVLMVAPGNVVSTKVVSGA